MRKKEEDKVIIEVEEDVKIPGTKIILEKGDRIEVLQETDDKDEDDKKKKDDDEEEKKDEKKESFAIVHEGRKGLFVPFN